MSNIDKQALTDEAISKAFAGTNFGRDDFKNILAETVIDAAAGWRCGYTATTICTQLGLLTPKGCASALGLRFISEHVQRETKRLKDELEAKDKLIAELSQKAEIYDMLREDYELNGSLVDFVDWQAKRIIELEEKQRLIDICQGQGLEHRIAAEKRAEAAEKRIAELSHHLQCAHGFIEHTEAFGHEASNGILCCGDAQWNIDASKSVLTAAGKGEAS